VFQNNNKKFDAFALLFFLIDVPFVCQIWFLILTMFVEGPCILHFCQCCDSWEAG
jgi:hypothetical protein